MSDQLVGTSDESGPWRAAHEPAHARSRSGRLAVVTTPMGLPISVRIDSGELAKDPAVLGNEIFRLCRQAAMSAGVRLREDLLAGGVDRDVVDGLNLAKADDLARAEYQDDAVADAPSSWMRRD